MPVDGKDIGADFVVGSGHKSMASPAPSGVLATTNEWAPKIFRTTQMAVSYTHLDVYKRQAMQWTEYPFHVIPFHFRA